MLDYNKIVENYNNIISERPDKRRFYHLKSFHNFLKHFEEIKNPNDKAHVLAGLIGWI